MLSLLLVFLAAVAVCALAGFGLSRLRPGRVRSLGLAALMAVGSVLLALFVLEAGMRLFFAQSDGFNLTMSSRNWFARYWQPINSLGYRDAEPAPKKPGERLVLVVGDSFVAGHGINRASDRFADRLGAALGAPWRVANAAKIGWDTPDEYEALRIYPVAPDVVVLAYFVNDIYRACDKKGFALPFTVQFPKGAAAKYLVDHSALANFVYWRLARMGNMEGAVTGFWDRLNAAYNDPDVWAEHAAELGAVVAWCLEHHARLVALTIPNLANVAGSAAMTGKVAGYLRGKGVEVVDLTGRLAGRKPSEMVVNGVDAHANEALNAEIADLLRDAILNRAQPPD